MSDRAFITPKVLKWARESARMSLETAASKVSVSSDKLNDWEEGISQPTIKQAEALSKVYRRSLAIFFLPEVPRDFQPLQDFRRKTAKKLGTASVFIIREIQQKQAWISDLYLENGENQLPFVGKFSIKSTPQNVAKDILSTLKIDPLNYSSDNPIREWITKAEMNGIFISRTSFIHTRLKLDSEELQGFAISDKYAPFVFINSDDWSAPQLFTLIHELAHVWIAVSGISNEIEPELKHKDKLHPIELFCNEVAANALLPIEIMNKLDYSVFNTSKSVFSISKRLGVSSFTFLYRAFSLDIISMEKYRKLKKDADTDFQTFLLKEEEKSQKRKEEGKKTIVNPYLLQLNRNSRLFTQTVLDAFRGGYIQPTQASNLLNTQVNNFPKLEAILYK